MSSDHNLDADPLEITDVDAGAMWAAICQSRLDQGRPLADDIETEAVAESERLIPVLSGLHFEGLSLACVARIDAAEAAQRLGAEPLAEDDPFLAELDPLLGHARELIVGITDVPGGCIVSQRWGFTASTPGVVRRLSEGTVCYGMYANPKSGNQGSAYRDGGYVGSDLHPGGGWVLTNTSVEDVLRSYLYAGHALAYCCAFVGLSPTDARAFTGTPDVWLDLPPRDYWT